MIRAGLPISTPRIVVFRGVLGSSDRAGPDRPELFPSSRPPLRRSYCSRKLGHTSGTLGNHICRIWRSKDARYAKRHSLSPQRHPPSAIRYARRECEDWSASQLNFHNKAIREEAGKHFSQVLKTK